MDVAAPGVEPVRPPDSVLRRDRSDALEGLGKPRARHDAVLDVEVGRHPAHGTEGGLAPEPEPRPLRLVLSDGNGDGPTLEADAADFRKEPVHAAGGPIELDEKHRLGVAGITGGDDARLDNFAR